MSKEEITKALKNIKIRCHPKVVWDDTIDSDLDTIEKSLKALEIIKSKNVDIRWIEVCDTVKDYNKGRDEHLNYELTQDEFELLKEVLE